LSLVIDAARSPADASPDWFAHEPLRLLDQVEMVAGADDQPLLFHRDRGTYVRVSPSGVRLVGLLDGTRTGAEIVAAVTQRSEARGDAGRVAGAVERFLRELRQAHVLNVVAEVEPGRDRVVRAAGRTHLARLPLTRSTHVALAPVARAAAAVPRPLAVPLGAGVLVAALVVVVWTLATQALVLGAPLWPAVVVVVLVQIVLHEIAHALVCQLLGTPVREAGVGLLFYVLPVAYVDRTDAYRVRSRWGRAAIALAGPANDLLFAAGAALLVLLGDGAVADTGRLLLLLELLALLSNANPLLPTDGYHAAEALAGELNLRGRALQYLAHRVTGADAPSALAALSTRRARGYLVFAAACVAYLVFMVVVLAVAVVGLVL